jgi:hypothetical protein
MGYGNEDDENHRKLWVEIGVNGYTSIFFKEYQRLPLQSQWLIQKIVLKIQLDPRLLVKILNTNFNFQ